MEILIVVIVALAGALLSFFSGFGLGTMLLPAFLLLFPPQIAVAAAAVVHMANNVFKLFLVGKYADRKTVIVFGTWSVIGALAGALLLEKMGEVPALTSYSLGEHTFEVTGMKLFIALVIFVFTLLEFTSALDRAPISRKWFPLGGLLSGFFGGLSGHQGALRSSFLMKAGFSKETFMGTRVVCACLVDLTRISVYTVTISQAWQQMDIKIVAIASLAAFTGAFIGNKLMHKSTLGFVQGFVAVSLILFSILLGAGIV